MKTIFEKIKDYNEEYQNQVDVLNRTRQLAIEHALQDYYEQNAQFDIGDIIRAKTIQFFMKIDRISAEISYDIGEIRNHYDIKIIYHGKAYKKVNNRFERTKNNSTQELMEDNAILVDNIIIK